MGLQIRVARLELQAYKVRVTRLGLEGKNYKTRLLRLLSNREIYFWKLRDFRVTGIACVACSLICIKDIKT